MRKEEILQAALSGHRIEPIPKTFDFGQAVERLNIMLSYDSIVSAASQE